MPVSAPEAAVPCSLWGLWINADGGGWCGSLKQRSMSRFMLDKPMLGPKRGHGK